VGFSEHGNELTGSSSKGKVCPYACHESLWGSGNIAPLTLNLSASWRCVVSFAPPPLYPRRKSHRFPLKRILSGPHSRSGSFGEEKNSFFPLEINHDCHSFRNLATIPNELSPFLGSKGAGNLFTRVVRIKF
jgi:hypothetical protein